MTTAGRWGSSAVSCGGGEQWERSHTRDLPDMDRLLAGLAAAQPPESAPTIVHGDYRLDNTVVDLSGDGAGGPSWWRSWTGSCPRSVTRWPTSA